MILIDNSIINNPKSVPDRRLNEEQERSGGNQRTRRANATDRERMMDASLASAKVCYVCCLCVLLNSLEVVSCRLGC